MTIIFSLAIGVLAILIGDTILPTTLLAKPKISIYTYFQQLEGRSAPLSTVNQIYNYLQKLIKLPLNRLKIDDAYQTELLNRQLKDMLYSISSSLKAGYSLATSLERCLTDLKFVSINQKETTLLVELGNLVNRLQLGDAVEDALPKFSTKLAMEDVHDLVNGILITKNKGGNLAEIMETIAQTISEKLAVQLEIKVLTASKVMEARLLGSLPIFMLIILSLTSPEYLEPLYQSPVGQTMLVISFLLILTGFIVTKKMTKIDI
jgi:tight adherence protein B